MTLLVGILCNDGAVIAADRQLTQGLVGTPSSKIRRVNENTLFASSGPVGMGQQVEYILRQSHHKFGQMDYAEAAIQMQPIIQEKILSPSYAIPKMLGRQIEPCECLFASVFKDGLCLSHMDGAGKFTKLTEEHFLCCSGSGELNGLALLSVIRSVLFPDKIPTLETGIIAASATVKMAIDLRSPGVGFDVDVSVLRSADNQAATAEEISPEHLSENVDLLEWAKKQLIAARDNLSGKSPPSPPKRRDVPPA